MHNGFLYILNEYTRIFIYNVYANAVYELSVGCHAVLREALAGK